VVTADTNFFFFNNNKLIFTMNADELFENSDISKSKWNALRTETKGDIINSVRKKYELALEMGQKLCLGLGY